VPRHIARGRQGRSSRSPDRGGMLDRASSLHPRLKPVDWVNPESLVYVFKFKTLAMKFTLTNLIGEES